MILNFKLETLRHYLNLLIPFSRFEKNVMLSYSLNHVQSNIYVFMAPFIAKQCFPNLDGTSQLLVIYSFLCTSIITRPLGIFIASLGLRKVSVNTLLNATIICSIFASILMYLVFVFTGIWSSILLLAARFLLGCSMSAECIITRMILFEDKNISTGYKAGAYLEGIVMMSLLIASAMSTFFYSHEYIKFNATYLILACIYIVIFVHRLNLRNIFDHTKLEKEKFIASSIHRSHQYTWYKIQKIIGNKFNIFITITLVHGISYLTYLFPFVLMNSLIPLLTPITLAELNQWNTILLIFDFLFIPILAHVLRTFNPYSVMMHSLSILILIFTLLSFTIHNEISIYYILFMRFALIFFGVIFLTPQLYYFNKCFKLNQCDLINSSNKSENMMVMGLARSVSSGLFSKITPLLCTLFIHKYNSFFAVGLYGSAISILTFICLYLFHKSQIEKFNPYNAIGIK